MTLYHILIGWLLIAAVSVIPLVLAAVVQVRHYWSVVEMRLVLAALAGQALFQSIAAGMAFTSLPVATLGRAAPPWLILFTVGDIAMVLPLVILALMILRYRMP